MPVRAAPNHKMKAPSYPFYDWASIYDWINKPWKLHDDVWKSCKFLNSFAVHSRSKLHFILTSFWLIVKIFSAFIFQQTMSLNDFPASSGFSLAWLLAFTKPFAWLVFRVVSWFTPWGVKKLLDHKSFTSTEYQRALEWLNKFHKAKHAHPVVHPREFVAGEEGWTSLELRWFPQFL